MASRRSSSAFDAAHTLFGDMDSQRRKTNGNGESAVFTLFFFGIAQQYGQCIAIGVKTAISVLRIIDSLISGNEARRVLRH